MSDLIPLLLAFGLTLLVLGGGAFFAVVYRKTHDVVTPTQSPPQTRSDPEPHGPIRQRWNFRPEIDPEQITSINEIKRNESPSYGPYYDLDQFSGGNLNSPVNGRIMRDGRYRRVTGDTPGRKDDQDFRRAGPS